MLCFFSCFPSHPLFPTTTFSALRMALSVMCLAKSETDPADHYPLRKINCFLKQIFPLPHSHAFEVLNINTSHGKVVIWGATNYRKKLPVSLKMTFPLLTLKEFGSLFCWFLLSRCVKLHVSRCQGAAECNVY